MKKNSAKLAIIVSEFNPQITEALFSGALEKLKKTHHIAEKNITVVRVPGAVEIPFAAKLLAKSQKYQAIICLGAVIKGETDHYDYVCQQVSFGCQKVMLTFDIPIIFGVLTTQTLQQAKQRSGGKHGHKGEDCADAAISMIALKNSLMS